MSKIKYIEATNYGIIGTTGAPSRTVGPGDRVHFQEGNPAHEEIASQAGFPGYEHVRIVDVDPDAERAAEKEREEQLKEAEKIAAQARQEQLNKERAAAGEGKYNPEEHNVDDVLEYLKGASEEEAARVQELEHNSQRDSRQIAGFIPRELSE